MHLHHRNPGVRQRILQRQPVVRQRPRIDDYPVNPPVPFLHQIHQRPLVIGLPTLHRHPQRLGPFRNPPVNLRQRQRPVMVPIPPPQRIQIRPVQHQYHRHSSLPLSSPSFPEPPAFPAITAAAPPLSPSVVAPEVASG